MKVFIMTLSPEGYPAIALERLHATKGVELGGVILVEGIIGNRRKFLRRKLSKIRKIGLAGAWIGWKMRDWFSDTGPGFPPAMSLEAFTRKNNIPFIKIPQTQVATREIISAIQNLGCDMGISMGNGYISSGIFSIPPLGMINIHHELLPEMKGASPIIWQIFHNSVVTGFTIHQISKKIDGGRIWVREEMTIKPKPSLEETVRSYCPVIKLRSIDALCNFLQDYDVFVKEKEQPQMTEDHHHSYTTPTFRQFRIMQKNFRELFKSS